MLMNVCALIILYDYLWSSCILCLLITYIFVVNKLKLFIIAVISYSISNLSPESRLYFVYEYQHCKVYLLLGTKCYNFILS